MHHSVFHAPKELQSGPRKHSIILLPYFFLKCPSIFTCVDYYNVLQTAVIVLLCCKYPAQGLLHTYIFIDI